MRFKGKAAIVTGGARGIGGATSMALAEQGAAVIIMDVGSTKDGSGADETSHAQETADAIKAKGGKAIALPRSVVDNEACKEAVELCVKSFGSIDILVNNAGILRPKMIWNMPEEDWDLVVAVHLKGHYNMLRYAALEMRKQNHGRIINTASEAFRGTIGQANYGAAKGGIWSLTKAAARELGRYNITVNTICPAAATRLTLDANVKAGFDKRLAAGLVTRERYDAVVNMGGPEHIAPFICYLATDEAANINGQAFRIEEGKIAIYSEPELKHSLVTAGKQPFDLDTLIAKVPSSLLQGYQNPAPAGVTASAEAAG